MSIYATNSDSYWKERQKSKSDKKSPFLIAGIVLLTFVAISGSFLHIRKRNNASSDNNNRRTLSIQKRTLHQTTETDWSQCESRVNSRQECTLICQQERNSIPKPTMHQACLHGCQMAHVASVALGCRGKLTKDGKDDKKGKSFGWSTKSSQSDPIEKELTEEDVFGEIGIMAYDHCAKFQQVDPKPNVFVTCRKYHRAGTKQGFRMGMDVMKEYLDKEWDGIMAEQ